MNMDKQLQIKPLLYSLFLLVILPNAIFVIAAFSLGDNRSYINIDYLLPACCFLSRRKLIKVIGAISFLLIFFIDLLLIVLQHFPTFHFNDTLYLLGYIFYGPKTFLIYGTVVIALVALEVIGSWYLAKKIDTRYVVAVVFLLLLANAASYFIDDTNGEDTSLFHTSLMSSNSIYFLQNQQKNFSTLLGGDQLINSPYHHATEPWTEAIASHKALNKKLFLIIIESWGQPLNVAIQEDILKNLKAKSSGFDYFKQGSFTFRGFTVEGELRELCQLYPTTLDLYKIKTGFQHCLPHLLNEQGYKTQAIHGGGSAIYGRKSWWPKAGFNTLTFQEDLNKPVNCIPFSGICDWDILPFIKQAFADNKKRFNYWLTLTSHYEYHEHDIHNRRFNCSAYDIPTTSDACRNLMLQAQLFDYIAKLMMSPEMKGVEVIIVGDHPPPLFSAREIALFKTKDMRDGKVGWVHFRVKK